MARETKAVLTNMCMVCDGDCVLVQDKINSSYTGVTFPGGHVEAEETLTDSIIREVREESGLFIKHPVLCGIYDWITESGARYLVFIYKAEEFTGSIHGSEEGNVRWVKKEDFLKEPLAHGMDKVFEIATGQQYTECFCDSRTKEEILM